MIGFLDCYSGISGDMLLGALVDGGLAVEEIRATVAALGLEHEVSVEAAVVTRGGLRATKVTVSTGTPAVHRRFGEVAAVVEGAALPVPVRERALAVLRRIAEVEARIHGQRVDDVELHEVGALDAIVDVVAGVAGLAALGIERLGVSALPVAPGETGSGGHHGRLPSPAPATLALIADAGAPVRSFGDGRELVTPTGAALAVTLGRFEQPAMRIVRVGYGAGSAEMPWPNILRFWVGEGLEPSAMLPAWTGHVVLEANIDDMSPQLMAVALDELRAAGALDVVVGAVQMKKGRPGSLVTVVAETSDEDRLARILLSETTTLGVRVHDVRRHEAGRRFETVATPFGVITVKCKVLDGKVAGVMPEFESVRDAARAAGVPVVRVHAAATAAAQSLMEEG